MTSRILQLFRFCFDEMGDKRVMGWPLMKDPIYPLLIITGYIYIVYSALPKYMSSRKPYSLKKFIQAYNLLQIGLNVAVIFGFTISGWATHLPMSCDLVDYSENPQSRMILSTLWWVMMLKMFEFIETFIFILRKKTSQVTYLHVYHHASTVCIAWIATKYVGGGMSVFPVLLNTSIHVIMYSYYFVSTLGDDVQKKIGFLKKKLTLLQLVQFVIVIIHASQAFREDCKMSPIFAYTLLPDVVIVFSFFLNFYVKKYATKKKFT